MATPDPIKAWTRKYRVKYVWTSRFGRPAHSYEVVGAKGGVHLHITDLGEDNVSKYGGPRHSAGLEFHWRHAPENRAPDHEVCWLLKCPCWHEGTSLYAEERFLPMFQGGASTEDILSALCVEADRQFEPAEAVAS